MVFRTVTVTGIVRRKHFVVGKGSFKRKVLRNIKRRIEVNAPGIQLHVGYLSFLVGIFS